MHNPALDAWGDYDLDNPYPLFAQIQADGPVHEVTLADGHRAWLVVRHEEAPPPPPRRASRIGQDALVAAGQESLASPEDSPLTPREEAVVAAGEEESVSLEGEAPVAAEAVPEPEWSPASKPDAPSGKEE